LDAGTKLVAGPGIVTSPWKPNVATEHNKLKTVSQSIYGTLSCLWFGVTINSCFAHSLLTC